MIAEAGAGPAMMVRTSQWPASIGRHDGVDRSSASLLQAPAPVTWFVRTTPFAAVNPSITFDGIVNLPRGESMRLGCRVVVCSGGWDRSRLAAYVKEHPCSA